MLSVALTGNIASGKSEVARRFAQHGAMVIDADELAREVVEPGEPAWQDIVARWGRRVLLPDERIDRTALRRIVFSDHEARAALERIVHPRIGERRAALLREARARGTRIVISDIPLLFEAGLEDQFDRVVLVDAPEAVRLARLHAYRGLGEAEARRMIEAQMPSDAKRPRATYVIDNDGSLTDLWEGTDRVWAALTRDADARP
ncbi:MAG TPA: dephospho-CoA kinase [Gemmatimonadaceae bacterium]|nr:dephospho-CoA kinase [Gemmatimonadaceae bacterium]